MGTVAVKRNVDQVEREGGGGGGGSGRKKKFLKRAMLWFGGGRIREDWEEKRKGEERGRRKCGGR